MKKKPNKFPEYLTKVTPFSKVLAAILFITLPFLGFVIGIKYQQLIGEPVGQNRCPMYNHRMFINKPGASVQQSPDSTEDARPPQR